MALTKPLHPDEKLTAGPVGKKIARGGLVAGAILLIVLYVVARASGKVDRFMHSYLLGFTFILSIAYGGLFFVLIQHISRARWSIVLRRLAEFTAGTFPVLLVLSLGFVIPIMTGYDGLYYWTTPEGHADHLIHGKAAWLNEGFFGVRIILYLLGSALMARYFLKKSLEQDESKNTQITEKLRVAAAPGIIAFSFIVYFSGMDLLMTLAPKWFSTMYGVYWFAGCGLAIHAFIALFAMVLQRAGRIVHSINVEHYHDVGKYTFGFIFFWSYVAFSQFMLIWYAALPEETTWFHIRMSPEWVGVTLLLVIGHFAFPFLALMSRHAKRRLPIFAGLCVWVLVIHAVDLYWNIAPQFDAKNVEHGHYHFTLSFFDFGCLAAMFVLFIGAVAKVMGDNPLLPVGDPKLESSLAFENF